MGAPQHAGFGDGAHMVAGGAAQQPEMSAAAGKWHCNIM